MTRITREGSTRSRPFVTVTCTQCSEILSWMKLLTRLRLFLHVLAHGCRITDFVNLHCEGCKHETICNLGRYDPK